MKSQSFRPSVLLTGILLLLVTSCATGFVMTEVGYRLYLRYRYPAVFRQQPQPETYAFVSESVWTYDQEVGYRYKPNFTWLDGQVNQGRLLECNNHHKTDAFGNVGSSGADYQDAEFKVLVFGDSVTAQAVGDLTYPALLERELSQRLGRRVSVINLGRDGYGVLQMIDLAVREIPRWKPDMVLINFITDDLDRARFWRTETLVDGRARLFTTSIADPNPPPSLRVDTILLASGASQEWCNKLTTRPDQSDDPILRQLTETFIKASASRVKPTLWGLDYSVTVETIRYGDPFAFLLWRLGPNQRIGSARYDDARLVAGLKFVQGYGIPVHYIHLPIHPEIKAGSYNATLYKGALLSDFERLLGRPVLKSLPFVKAVPGDVDRIPAGKGDNMHPSPFGMQVYATALANMLDQLGALDSWRRHVQGKP